MRKMRSIILAISFIFPASIFGQYYGVENPIAENWSVGINIGVSGLMADVQTDLIGYQGGFYVQKLISPSLDVRLGFDLGSNTGLDVMPSQGFRFNSALNGERDSMRFYDSTMKVFHNYRMSYRQISFLFKWNLNRAFSPTGSEKYDLYALAGISAYFYKTQTNVFDERTGEIYPYESINLADPLGVKYQLKNLLDTSYETLAQQDNLNSTRFGNYIYNPSFVIGFGGRYKLTEDIALGLEGKMQFIGDDLLDGQQFLETNEQSLNNDRPFRVAITLDYTF